ncbi:MAG: FMN-binding protein [Candidatus Latescibacter sp.]|nr:FMN-binding protein [Candidatus Latescibacter sp.]
MKMKKTAAIITVFFVFFLGLTGISQAVVLLTKEQALKQVFPDVDQVTTETITLTSAEAAKIKGRLGGQLVHFQAGSESGKIGETLNFTFYIGVKNNKQVGVAVIDAQPGKWGPVDFIIRLTPTPAKVQNMAVMAYQEKRGRPIARNNFLDQFTGKGSSDPIALRKDIRAISGATISSECTCFAVKKVIALYEEAFLPRLQSGSLTLKK